MDFINTVLNSIKKSGVYTLGDVKFLREDNGVSLQFNKKEPLPASLLTGIGNDLLQSANPPEIDLNRNRHRTGRDSGRESEIIHAILCG